MTAFVICITTLACIAGLAFSWWSLRNTRNAYYVDYLERNRPDEAKDDATVTRMKGGLNRK